MGTTCVCGVYQIHGFYFFASNLVLLPFRNADLVSLVYWSGWVSPFADLRRRLKSIWSLGLVEIAYFLFLFCSA